ncbi:hypothetical protein [Hymenobacter sp. CRA2]|uniref:hypothetical protein n=1 Tax=Hymenobacter sp. CRA2 TaxID=1955620 RepID=UPI00098F5FBB|nr:hypothetical protein [Hymenobacter sp. CRA2]OON70295.1 hypothetical protein B0919_06070 [Hymenobacter sp. CRA2]
MSVNLDYLDPNLVPLEDKVKAYLAAEEDLQQALVEARTLQATHNQTTAAATAGNIEEHPASTDQLPAAPHQKIQQLQGTIQQLGQEILQLLPERDAWVKVNLGYGPSRVGAWRDEEAPEGETRYLIRVVQ